MPRDGTVRERNADREFDLVRRALMLVILVLLAFIVGSFVF
ncbi:MAG TPA: hypothetical protein VJ898_02930 [Natrialbaceae archaeon]|nr:hypothetical protein [Natrialbaceae archaeon]